MELPLDVCQLFKHLTGRPEQHLKEETPRAGDEERGGGGGGREPERTMTARGFT